MMSVLVCEIRRKKLCLSS